LRVSYPIRKREVIGFFWSPMKTFPGQWKVNCWDAHFLFDFQEIIGPYRVVSPAGLERFIEVAEEKEYKVAFFEDPLEILKDYEALKEPPDVTLFSSFSDTQNGFLPFQVQGYNMLKDLHAGVAMWDTGTGKTVLATGLLLHHLQKHNFDTAFVVTKKVNRVNTQRKMWDLGNISTDIVPTLKRKKLKSGTYYPRREFYESLIDDTDRVVIAHYELFRVDKEELVVLFHDRRILVIWDEMPTKLKNRTSELYQAVKWCLYDWGKPDCPPDKIRPSWLTQYMLSATPIENNPEDWLNCMRLLDSTIYGKVSQFRKEFVSSYSFFDKDKPEEWHKLDKMGLKAAHVRIRLIRPIPKSLSSFRRSLKRITTASGLILTKSSMTQS
jgi:hypothetical protein